MAAGGDRETGGSATAFGIMWPLRGSVVFFSALPLRVVGTITLSSTPKTDEEFGVSPCLRSDGRNLRSLRRAGGVNGGPFDDAECGGVIKGVCEPLCGSEDERPRRGALGVSSKKL